MVRSGHDAPSSGIHHEGPSRKCQVAECAAARRAVERERWRTRQGRTAAAPTEPREPGPSGRAARTWLDAQGLEALAVPAAADLLVVADTIDSATAGGQIQFIAALARQAAALRAELAPRTDPDDPEGDEPPAGVQEVSGADPGAGGGPRARSFDASTL